MKNKSFLIFLLLPFLVRAQELNYPGDPFTEKENPPLRVKKLAAEAGAGLLGGLLGGVVGFTAGVTYLMYPVIPEKMHVYAYLFAAPMGAVLGHNLTRSYAEPVYNALLQRQAGRLTFGMPTPKLAVYPSGKHKLQWRLVDLHF